MSLQRQNAREELVAIIAAGRELSPEYDYALADVFLDGAHRRLTRQSPFSALLDGLYGARTLFAAACLALAALMFPLLLSHTVHDGPGNQPALVPRAFDPDRFYGGDNPSWPGSDLGPRPSTSPSTTW